MDEAAVAADAVALLELLCRQPSVSAEERALESTAALVEELLADAGFETALLRAGAGPPAVWGEQRGRSPYTLLLYNHYDVQPADPLELWDSPPFEPARRDGRLFARGAADNKGELAVRLAVVRALRARHAELPLTLRWIIEGEEEVLSPHFDEIVRLNVESLRADACMWEGAPARLDDGRPAVALGFKGSVAVRLDVRLLSGDAHSAAAAFLPSAAWRLVEALSSLRRPDGTVRVAGFYDRVRAPTAVELRAIADQSESIELGVRSGLGIDTFLDDLTGTALLERWAFAPTSNISGLKAGYSGPGMKTVLPGEASAWLDFRLVPDQRADEIVDALRSHLARDFSDVAMTVLGTAEPAGTPIDHPFVQQVVRIAEEVAGARASIAPRAAATLPIIATLERHLGVPGVAAPGNPFSFGAGAHAPNEHVKVDDIGHAARFTYTLLERLGGAEPSYG